MDRIIAIMVVAMVWALIVFIVACFVTESGKTKSAFWDKLMAVACKIALILAIILLLICSLTIVDEYIL